ncbi:MAG: hypothetical protein L3J47_00560 [Sulfurovum sp.]|nr:hypothetical protein [Sulfurovum sp.]
MSAKEVADLDREHGNPGGKESQDDDPQTHPSKKEPWYSQSSRGFEMKHKSEEDLSGLADMLAGIDQDSHSAKLDKMTQSLKTDDRHLDDDGLAIEDAKKALTSQSMYIPADRARYSSLDITRSAATATSNKFSALQPLAPDVAESISHVISDEEARTHDTMKSCEIHNIIFKSQSGCRMCETVSKSMSCGGCGNDLHKVTGGAYKCGQCE